MESIFSHRLVSPPSQPRLRKSKSVEIIKSLRRKISSKSIRSGDSEHPSLRAGPHNNSNPAFEPTSSLPSKRRLKRHQRSLEAAPPIPPLPPDPDEYPMQLDTNLEDMGDIVDRAMLYHGGSDPNSPDSGMSLSHSGHSNSHIGSRIKFNNPFASGSQLQLPFQASSIPGPTDADSESLSGYFAPQSWGSKNKHGPDPKEEAGSSSDDEGGGTSNTAESSRWKIRIYGPDDSDHVLRVSINETVADLTPRLNLKLPAREEREIHELYLKERGRERILSQHERPASILRRRLHQAGYDETDGHDLLIGTVIPFLLKFVYRSQFYGSAVEQLSFTNFEYIDLTGRSLGTIPVALHQHADSIVSLRLCRNPMIDIPLDFVESCTALSKLYLSHMSMKKVPLNIRHSTTLTLLDLSSNRIVTLENSHLEDLSRLTTLYIQNNRLKTLPRTFARLHELAYLNISNNKFHTFPSTVTELSNLRCLDISFNSIFVLPEEIGRLANLERLVIVGNQVSTLPDGFRHLIRLSEFDCRRNRIVDLGVTCVLPVLETLSAGHNNIQKASSVLGPCLTVVDVSYNDLSLPLHDVLSRKYPVVLTSLDISNAKISVLDEGAIAQMVSLRTLKADRNSLRTIPESLGDLKWLETLSCADNALSELPQSIGKLQKLEILDVHSNSLTALPVSLWNCASLSRLNVTSNLLVLWHDPPPFVPQDEPPTPLPTGKLIPSPTFAPRRPSVASMPDIPPMAHSLEMLYLGENSLTDEMLHPLMILKELRVLNLSFNHIQEMPSNFFKDLTNLEEVFLSGNRLTHIPSEDLPRLTRLSTLFLNGNHLQHIPHELGQVKSLTLLDVGHNMLKYNINNLDYDWNWNFNKNLMYLNLSGNKQLQIKSDVSNHGQRPSISSIDRRSLSGFSGLSQLRVLGLMDVTITTTGTDRSSDIPDESENRRVRTSSSLVNGLSYGIADTLGKNRNPHMMDLVHEFRGLKKDTVFAMFGRAQPANQTAGTTSNRLAKFLKDNFIRVFISQLNSLDPQREEGVPDALRRAFLKLNQDFHDALFGPVRKMSLAGGPVSTDSSLLHSGASGIVVYIVGKTMYVANVGNALAIVSRGGTPHPVSRKHEPYDRAETIRIRAAEGWISPPGRVNDELDISRSFGFYHLMPMVNARPDVCEYELTDLDDSIIIANRGLWDYVEYQTAVDIVQGTEEATTAAQKLRDLAISYGAEGSTMIMVVSLANLFKEEATAVPVDRRKWRGIGVIDHTLNRLKDEVPPPVGHVAIVFTDIKGSTHLWEATPSGMITAIHLHNSLLRRYLRVCGGYEVRTEGDCFMCSFPTVLAAVWWCLTIQVELLNVSWPQDILECADGREVYDTQGRLIFRGLSVRVGIHCGMPLCLTDPVTNRMDYFGLMVTRAARIGSTAAGGQIMFSSDVLSEINARVFEMEAATEYSDAQPKEAIDAIRRLEPVVVPEGEVKLKGLEVPEMLSFVLPGALMGRRFHKDAVVVEPTSTGSPATQFTRPRELSVRLERTAADRVVRSPSEGGASVLFDGDNVLLSPNPMEPTDTELTTLSSLLVRIENAENRLRTNQAAVQAPQLNTKEALVSALRKLDERTLEEVWSMLHNA